MAFIRKNYKDISDAKNRGDKRAIAIFKALCDGCPQDQLDDMVEAFLTPIPENVPEMMPNSGISQFGAGNVSAQPQALKPVVSSMENMQKDPGDKYFKGTVFHGDADEFAPGYAPEKINDEDDDLFDSMYEEDTNTINDNLEDAEETYYDGNTIDKINSLLQDKNLSQNDITTLLKEMKTRK